MVFGSSLPSSTKKNKTVKAGPPLKKKLSGSAHDADPDEMVHNLGLHCLSKYLFIGFQYKKGFKVSNTFLFLSLNRIWVIRAGIHKMLVRIANREDPD